ncbi:hypothetical protein Curi_c14250 [Gottschalkia acidurici 9a]|uniref:Uncharacterized protein n=1 Tax=Gottschalkia acidurici (strain ATCC 7906 / DSM 604 / BCRC 14475 / CIP 104303 / KCTC 5404 / NCIMB 10678 / 9a) TaxID=1128398 RepID=K0B0K6_GOTA9|nr:hypothetical protein [Gottschalkia acidurici]AFS78435.1 hypothetical protein Curi_c14250 [Gottschalkia acidurici 9a]
MCNGMEWDICNNLSSSYPLSSKNGSYEWEQKGKVNPVVEVICLHCGFVAGISTLVMR